VNALTLRSSNAEQRVMQLPYPDTYAPNPGANAPLYPVGNFPYHSATYTNASGCGVQYSYGHTDMILGAWLDELIIDLLP